MCEMPERLTFPLFLSLPFHILLGANWRHPFDFTRCCFVLPALHLKKVALLISNSIFKSQYKKGIFSEWVEL